MPARGAVSFLLHAHLPFVRHPEHEHFLEEDWLFEAITECYLPLLETFEELLQRGVRFRLNLVLTPTLLSMLSDPLLSKRFRRHLEGLIELAEREVRRTRADASLQPLARMYRNRFRAAEKRWSAGRGDLIGAFGQLEQQGCLDIFTSAATHAFLPLLSPWPQAVRAQLRCAVRTHRRLLGRNPRGIWLPECGMYHGLDALLRENGIEATVIDAHGLLHARPRPRFGVYAPAVTPTGLCLFARDLESSRQVWSAREGYPGHPDYRDFYRDIGWDLPIRQVRRWVQPDGSRKATGIKYHRITGPTAHKELYQPGLAERRALLHAAHFVGERRRQIESLHPHLEGRTAVIVAPFDAELFGHWWHEGPLFLAEALRLLDGDPDLYSESMLGLLRDSPPLQVVTPFLSSWGQHGYCGVWLDSSNDWIYNHLHRATEQMIALTRAHPTATGWMRRALNQCAREVLLAQSSDFPFMMKMNTTVDYAVRRVEDHLLAANDLIQQIATGRIRRRELAALEQRNNLFPDIDYRDFAI